MSDLGLRPVLNLGLERGTEVFGPVRSECRRSLTRNCGTPTTIRSHQSLREIRHCV